MRPELELTQTDLACLRMLPPGVLERFAALPADQQQAIVEALSEPPGKVKLTRQDIERLSQVDAGTLARFARLDATTQQQVIDATLAPAVDPGTDKASREIAEAHAQQLKDAIRKRGR